MTLLLRVLERIHGHLGWLSVAALLHPAVMLRRPQRRAPLSVGLTMAFVALSAILGGFIYPHYRERIKQHIFIETPALGWMFERKEHLAVGVVAFTLIGGLAHLSLPAFTDAAVRTTVARLAHRAFVVAFALGAIVAALGVAVASYKSF